MKVFEYVVVRTEGKVATVITAGPRTSPAILVGPKAVLAKDEATVRIIAAREIPEGECLEAVEILVRPFC